MSASLSIAFVAFGFPPAVGGTETYNAEYAARLVARAHRLRVYAFESGAGDVASDGVAVARLPRIERRGRIDPSPLLARLAADPPDVVLVSRASRRLRDVVRGAARVAPVVLAVHELPAPHPFSGPLGRLRARRRYGLESVARCVANSADTRERVLALGVPPDRVEIVHPGVDTERFRPDAAAGAALRRALGIGDAPMLLTVSRLAENKGHLRVVAALPRLRARLPRLVYVVVGEGRMREPIARAATEHGVADALRLVGRVPDVRGFLQACDAFVMLSSRERRRAKAGEGFGIGYLEAAACGKPVIASASGGGAEIVAGEAWGRVIDPGDAAAFERAALELLSDRDAAAGLAPGARRRALAFDWRCGAEALERALRAAARPREAVRP